MKNKTRIESYCEGCKSYLEETCTIADKFPDCPCTVCLIKGVCALGCEAYDTYWQIKLKMLERKL